MPFIIISDTWHAHKQNLNVVYPIVYSMRPFAVIESDQLKRSVSLNRLYAAKTEHFMQVN